jgi:hypothetical protein
VYDRQLKEEETLTFGVSGMLYRNGLIMFDRQTDSLWSHILGQAISGEYKGTQLTFLPALQTDWQSWRALYPETLVVNPQLFAQDVYDDYYNSPQAGVLGQANADNKLLTKEYVIGVRLKGEVKAYPFSVLDKQPVVNDRVGEVDIVVFFDRRTASGAVFERHSPAGELLTFQVTADSPGGAVDVESGSQWNILTGIAVSGSLKGTRLAQVPITYAFWFGWADYHGQGSVYQLNE